ncbi:MAG TPA: polysaccharide biosynthesis/export family protein [Allosphingosinicella sp.]|nr:polysaccharide biosynthesis/export family protein [Allosphingosinicella sp.]
MPATELPPPEGVDPRTGVRVYRVGPSDRLAISVYGVPDLSQTLLVDSSGRIAVPLAGAVEVAGKTPDEISREITQRLSTYVRNPQVSVNLEQSVSQVVTVDGQVTEPGVYPVVGRMTLMRAIAVAKGATEFARLQDVVVFRTVGDRQMAALYNLAAIRRGTYPDPEIYASDVIVVGDSPARRLFRDILQASPLFVAPIVALLQR